jgi:hypothetical protein
MVNPELVRASENKLTIFPNPSGFDANLAFNSKVNGTSVVTVINPVRQCSFKKNICNKRRREC